MSLPDSEGQNNLHIDTPAQTISSCGNQLKACDPAEEDTPRTGIKICQIPKDHRQMMKLR